MEFWAGLGGLAFAALALGLRCVVLAAEMDSELREAKARYMPNAVTIEFVEDLHPAMLDKLVARREVAAVLVGGGSPCQGNSALNSRRRGLRDQRSLQPEVLSNFVKDLKQAHADLPVFTLLENVGSCTSDVVSFYTGLMGGRPLEVDAAQWGFVRRRRLFWVAGPVGGVDQVEFVLPEGFSAEDSGDRLQIKKIDEKPWPPQVRWESGFMTHFAPAEVAAGRESPMHVFVREFPHPVDRVEAVDLQTRLRFEMDQRRFPPSAYSVESVLWRSGEWRQPSPNERAAVMGIPSTALQEVLKTENDKAKRIAKMNSAVGNSFHIPSVMLVLVLLFQLGERSMAVPLPSSWSSSSETRLRGRIRDTVFDEHYLNKSKFLTSNLEIAEETLRLLSGVVLPEPVRRTFILDMARLNLAPFQAYWVFLCESGHTEFDAPPDWQAQKYRGLASAATGQQRAAGNSGKGIDMLLQPGLGKEKHMAQARRLPSPFSADMPLDRDLAFALKAIAVFQDRVGVWREVRLRALRALLQIFDPVQHHVTEQLVTTARAVASARHVVLMSFLTAVLKWPDRSQPMEYVRGFRVMGEIGETDVFRKVQAENVEGIETNFFGPPAVAALQELLSKKPSEDHADIFEMTAAEEAKGYCSRLYSATDLNRRFGVGGWRPIVRFLIHQGDGKRRLIDDGRRGHHNNWAGLTETIYTVGLDFVPQVVLALHKLIFEQAILEQSEPEQFDLVEFFVADLPDAFRGLPVAPADQRATIVSVFDASARAWRFSIMHGCPFGLGSVVLQFNRYPALLVASARRILGLAVAAYFDDNICIEPHSTSVSARDAIMELMNMLGTPPRAAKTVDMNTHQVFLGAAITHLTQDGDSQLVIAPREATRAQVLSDLGLAVQDRSLTPAAAAKLRGRCGWLASNSFGRLGRLGSAVLKHLQYDRRSSARLTDSQVRALQFHRAVVAQVPPRQMATCPSSPRAPVVLYTDAEYTPGAQPRIGLVLFRDPPERPQGATFVLPEIVTDRWLPRKQQIFPAEAIGVPMALAYLARHLRGRDVIVFCDNAAAVSALIRGASKSEDVLEIAELFIACCLMVGCRCWIDWVDSHSNPADGLSRDGIQDTWTIRQGWAIRELQGTSFPQFTADPWRNASALLHWGAAFRTSA